ncbi:MAG: polysaccharide biosynthesis tyrosine autokinase [Anaerolineae bacterium]|jgi:non-specific protein-tyrosine kinase
MSERFGEIAMPREEDTVEIRRLLSVVRRRLWFIVACILLGAGSAFVVSSRMTPVYRASATMLIHQAPSDSTSDYAAILASQRLAETYAHILRGRPVLEEVISLLGLAETPDVLADRVEIKLVPDTQLIRLSVEHTDPTRAALIANSVGETFIAQIEALQRERYTEFLGGVREQIVKLSQLVEESQASTDALGTPTTARERDELTRLQSVVAQYNSTYATLQQEYEKMRLTAARATNTVILTETATVPTEPVRPRTLVNTGLAALTGALLAVGVAFLLEYLDDTIKTPNDVSWALGLSTVGAIDRLESGAQELVMATDPLSPTAEAFRVLQANIRFSTAGADGQMGTLLVTSPGPMEGKSITVANLGVAMAQAGLEVVVVDADLRRPRLHELLGVDPRPAGLVGALLEESTVDRLQPAHVEGLTVLPAGEPPPNPAVTAGSPRMQKLLDELAQTADAVLIDSPPVLPVADAAVLAQAVNGVLLVLEAGKTRRQAARRAAGSLRQVGANLVGVVLNAVPTANESYYYSYDDSSGKRRRRRAHGWHWQRDFLTPPHRLSRGMRDTLQHTTDRVCRAVGNLIGAVPNAVPTSRDSDLYSFHETNANEERKRKQRHRRWTDA